MHCQKHSLGGWTKGPEAGRPGRSTDHIPEGKDATACRGSGLKGEDLGVLREEEGQQRETTRSGPVSGLLCVHHRGQRKKKPMTTEDLQVYLLVGYSYGKC